MTIEELEKQLESDPYLDQNYLHLLDCYQDRLEDGVDEDEICRKVEKVRVQCALHCSPPLYFWMTWLTDCVIYANSDSSYILKIEELFDLAMRSMPHESVVEGYVDAMQSFYDEEKISASQMRSCFEKSLLHIGGDILTANAIWRQYRSFEVDEAHEIIGEFAGGSDVADVSNAKKRVISVFRQNLSSPLIGNEEVLQELDTCLGEICSESDVKIIDPDGLSEAFETSAKMKEIRLTFEENVTKTTKRSIKDRLHSWQAYIDFEMKDNQPSRALRLYDRAYMDCCVRNDSNDSDSDNDCGTAIGSFLEEYLHFSSKYPSQFDNATARAVKCRHCWCNLNVWLIRFLSLEITNSFDNGHCLSPILSKVPSKACGGGSMEIVENEPGVIGPAMPKRFCQNVENRDSHDIEVSSADDGASCALATLQRAMQCGRFSQAEGFNYVSLLLKYCDIYKRQLSKQLAEELNVESIVKKVKKLRNAFEIAAGYMTGYFDTWADGWMAFVSYKAKIEDTIIEDASGALTDIDNTTVESNALQDYEGLVQKFCHDEASSIAHVGIWLQYLNFLTEESCTRDIVFCRKVYKRAVAMTTASIMQYQPTSHIPKEYLTHQPSSSPGGLLYNHWQTFESRYGEANDVLAVMKKYRKYSVKYSSANSAKNNIKTKSNDSSAAINKKRGSDRDGGDVDASHDDKPLSKKSKSDEKCFSDLLGKANSKIDVVKAKSEGSDVGTTIIPGKYSLYVKNIDFSVTEEDLKNVFKANKYCDGGGSGVEGPSVVVRLTKTKGGKSRGMAHVDFPSLEKREEAMHLHNTLVKGRPITVERFVQSAYTVVDYHPSTIFIKNMTRDTNEENITEYLRDLLSQFLEKEGNNGEIIAGVKIMKCKRSGNSKGQALVQFREERYVAASIDAVKKSSILLNDRKITISQSKFPAVTEENVNGDDAEIKVSKTSITAPNKAHSFAGFKPRRLSVLPTGVKKSEKPKDTIGVNHQPVKPTNHSSTTSNGSATGTVSSKSNSEFKKFYK